MDFISNSELQVQEMLKTIGVASIDELFASVPSLLKLPKVTVDDGLSEGEGLQLMKEIAAKNTFAKVSSYLGAGAYEHHVPALAGAICSKSEFLTSYTPYQAESSQGMLQATFEFQSAIVALTGMDVANASLYDAATACAEAALMALRLKNERTKVVIAGSLHPHYRAVVAQCLNTHPIELVTLPFKSNGELDHERVVSLIDENTAAVLLQYPNFFGVIDDISAVSEHAKKVGALTILCANPLAYGLFASAGELGADIAVGDVQPLGLPLQFGGPYVGYIACKHELVRQMPGRIVGGTKDTQGRRGFTLTLQAREQHIRREKATSNICTNQALAALACLVTILWYGKEGIKKLALTNYQRAHYLKNALKNTPGIHLLGESVTFNEFAVRFDAPHSHVFDHFRKANIEPGIDLGKYYSHLTGTLLVAVTEMKSLDDLNKYIEVARLLLAK